MASEFSLLIDGAACEGSSGAGAEVLNPATGDSIGRVAYASPSDLERALEVSARGLIEWQAVPPWERGTILKRAADAMRADLGGIAAILTREQGKPLAEAEQEVLRSADFLEWAGEEARRITGRILRGRAPRQRIEIETHPIGVVAAFTPWNFPMALAAKKFAGALGAGCAIICKPPAETPGSVLAMANALLRAGVSPAAIAVVFGEPAAIADQLIASPVVSKVTFTGSIPVGKLLAAAAGRAMKPVTMELGGHAPTIVCGDVDPDATAMLLARAKFQNAGQICLSPSRFFVEASLCDRFTAKLVEHARALRVGNGMDPGTQMGPLATARGVQRISHLVEDARVRGAKIVAGGTRIGDRGFFYAPTVVTDVPADAEILRDEPFGPVAPILSFVDEREMLARANELPFGLSAYVFTNDPARQRRIADALPYGAVGVNDVVTHVPEVPLGGWRESGIGTEGGVEILQPYQTTKFVSICA